jgi:hypothetical protein
MVKRILLGFAVASTAHAQVAVRGVAYDSLHGRPLAGAFVGIAGTSVSAVSDSAGRFVLLNVSKGTHRVVMQHDVLDAIGLSAAGARAVVTGARDSVIIAVPSFATLFKAACGRTAPESTDSGFVFGTVLRGGRPVPAAIVVASWLDLYKDSTGTVRQKQKTMEIDADSTGTFALCGVPTTTGLSVRAAIGNSNGVWVDVAPLNRERIARQDLSIVSISTMRFDVPQAAVFAGRVRLDSTELSIADAEVYLTDLGLGAMTNERGEFRIAGVSPGQHVVQVRKIGYSFSPQAIHLAAGEVTDRTLVLSRIAALDSVRVKASAYSPNDEAMRLFEENRRLGLGKFFTRADLEKARARPMVDILGGLPGTKPRATGSLGYILSNRGLKSMTECSPMLQDDPDAVAKSTIPSRRGGTTTPRPCTEACFPHVFLDGTDVSPREVPNINRFNPDQLEAIEYYAGGAQVPPEYNRLNSSYCGVIVLHTRRGKSP